MIDPNTLTNAVAQAASNVAAASQAAAQIKETVLPWMPAIAIASGWAGRELNRATASAKAGAEWAMSHGGLLKLAFKICWN